MDEAAQLEYYMSYSHNINKIGPKGVTGTGNMCVYLYHSDRYQSSREKSKPAFVSGRSIQENTLPRLLPGSQLMDCPDGIGFVMIKSNGI